jgi:hypothetical protein
VTEKPKQPKQQRKVFDVSWETEDESEEVAQQNHDEESGEDDVEGHASGFNRPD